MCVLTRLARLHGNVLGCGSRETTVHSNIRASDNQAAAKGASSTQTEVTEVSVLRAVVPAHTGRSQHGSAEKDCTSDLQVCAMQLHRTSPLHAGDPTFLSSATATHS